MECKTCGYDSAYEWPEHGEREKPAKEPFIKLDGMQRLDEYGSTIIAKVFACPKCGTVKLDI